MITGEFTEDNQIIIPLRLTGPEGTRIDTDAILDTGFSDSLMLPDAIIRRLGLVELDIVQAVMADGSPAYFSTCEVVLEWDGEEREIAVFAGGGKPLLGMALVRGSLGTFEFFPGGTISLEPAG